MTNTTSGKAVKVGLGGAGWTWAASLPASGPALEALCAGMRAILVRGDDAVAVDEDVAWSLGEQDERWGSVRAYARLSAGQRRALVLATKLGAKTMLRSQAADLINALTARELAAA
jgi:hypothetical protein